MKQHAFDYTLEQQLKDMNKELGEAKWNLGRSQMENKSLHNHLWHLRRELHYLNKSIVHYKRQATKLGRKLKASRPAPLHNRIKHLEQALTFIKSDECTSLVYVFKVACDALAGRPIPEAKS